MDKMDKTKDNISMGQNSSYPDKKEEINLRRRNFVKIAAFGGVAFFAGKIFGPHLNMIQSDSVVDDVDKKILGNFKIIETDKQLNILDKKGNAIMVIDKGSL